MTAPGGSPGPAAGPPARHQPAADAAARRGADPAAVAAEIRAILASLTGREAMLHLAEGTPLLDPPVALDSLTGTLLLREVQRRFGVDVAGEDLNLDALATLGSLAAFVAERVRRWPAERPR